MPEHEEQNIIDVVSHRHDDFQTVLNRERSKLGPGEKLEIERRDAGRGKSHYRMTRTDWKGDEV